MVCIILNVESSWTCIHSEKNAGNEHVSRPGPEFFFRTHRSNLHCGFSQLWFNFAQWELQAGCNCYINAILINFIIIIIIIIKISGPSSFSQITQMLWAKQSDWCPNHFHQSHVPQIRFSHITDYCFNQSFGVVWNAPPQFWVKKTTSKQQNGIRGLCAIKCPKYKS